MLARLRKSAENKDSGFTLIELLVVMIIIGILAAIAIPAFLSQKKKAYQSSAKSDARSVALEVEAFLSDQVAPVAPAAPTAWTIANTGTTGAGLKTVAILSGATAVPNYTAVGNVTSLLAGNVQLTNAGLATYCIKATNNSESIWYTPTGQFTTAVQTVTGASCPA